MKAYHGNKWSGQEYDPVARRGAGNEQMHYILGGNKVAAPPQQKKVVAPSKYDIPSLSSENEAKYAIAKKRVGREGGFMAPTFSKLNKEPVS